jgi:hypothetical protein
MFFFFSLKGQFNYAEKVQFIPASDTQIDIILFGTSSGGKKARS